MVADDCYRCHCDFSWRIFTGAALMAFKLKKVFKKKRIVEFVKGAAIAVAAVYTGGAIYGALGAAGTTSLATGGLTLAQSNAQAKAAAANADAARRRPRGSPRARWSASRARATCSRRTPTPSGSG